MQTSPPNKVEGTFGFKARQEKPMYNMGRVAKIPGRKSLHLALRWVKLWVYRNPTRKHTHNGAVREPCGGLRMTITFRFNHTKAYQAALWFLYRHGGALDKLMVIKLIFFADRWHLAKYGRPIVGGRYCAMQWGPVCSELLDDMKKIEGGKDAPISVRGVEVTARASLNEEVLSESDIEALKATEEEYGAYNTFGLSNITHSLKAWRKNYPGHNKKTSRTLPYEDFFLDLDDDAMLEIIREDQEARDLLER